jgi:hypothetical protein
MSGKFLTVAVCASASLLKADFTFEQTTRMTGGMMMQAMKIAGAFSRQAREPMKSTTIVKGNRMVTLTGDSAHIIDLDKETITDVDYKKKTYSVVTFAQMAEALQQAAAKMKDAGSGQANPDVDFKIDVKDTGQSKVINGLNAKETILTFEMEGNDPRTNQKSSMIVTADTWSAPSIAGYDEVKNFYVRMGQKLNWGPGAMGMMQQPQFSRGMAEVMKQTAKIEGVPVLQITRMSMKGDGMDQQVAAAQAQADAQSQQQQQAPPPTAGSVAQESAAGAAASAAAGRMGRAGGVIGGLGGFGGFGRRKKQQEQQEQAAPPPQQQQPPAQTAPANPGLLSEMTSEMTSFSSGPADGSKLEVPSGFKQVESEMVKALRR